MEKILARVTETEDEIREHHGIDEEHAELRAALGFPESAPLELVVSLRAALLRTEPDFDLLHAEEGCAYDRLGLDGPPLWERCSRRAAPISPACGRATARHGVKPPRTPSGAGSPCGPGSSTVTRATWRCGSRPCRRGCTGTPEICRLGGRNRATARSWADGRHMKSGGSS